MFPARWSSLFILFQALAPCGDFLSVPTPALLQNGYGMQIRTRKYRFIQKGPIQKGPIQKGPIQKGLIQKGRIQKGPIQKGRIQNIPKYHPK